MIVIGGEQKGASTATKKVSNITIYDVKSKLIAYSGSFVDIQHVVNEFGSVFVIQGDGKVFRPRSLMVQLCSSSHSRYLS